MRVENTPLSPVSFSYTWSAMRCAAWRRSPATTAKLWPPRSWPRATSHNRKRTSKRPSASRDTLPVASASALFWRQAPRSGRDNSSRAGPLASRLRNCPLRSRSARMMADIFWGAASSPRNAATAIGTCVMPMPDTSTRNCACAGWMTSIREAKKDRHCRQRAKSWNRLGVIRSVGVGQAGPAATISAASVPRRPGPICCRTYAAAWHQRAG